MQTIEPVWSRAKNEWRKATKKIVWNGLRMEKEDLEICEGK